MPWFQCEDCGDSIKKPKLSQHCNGGCSASRFTCIDCSRTFDRHSVQAHNSCVTEHDKYAKGATKPGGFAEKGFFDAAGPALHQAPSAPEGLEFLSSRPPWACSLCSVGCTSEETLQSHAAGAKHKRRARAALAARQPAAAAAAEPAATGEPAATAESAAEVAKGTEKKREKKETKRKAAAAAAEPEEAGAAEDGAKAGVCGATPKWKKLATAELKKAGGALKVKKLQAALLAATGGGVEAGAEAAMAQLRKSSKFMFEGKEVRLKA